MSINAVAPLAGAWIEIHIVFVMPQCKPVAPLAGAWIEINLMQFAAIVLPSLPSRERGLK